MTSRDDLPNDIEALKALLIAEREKSAAKDARIDYLLEQFRLAQQKQFGKSAEGFAGQGELFNEAEETVEKAEPETQTVSYTRNKPKRKPLPKDLPRERIIHELSNSDKVCDCCQGKLHQIGEDKSEKLDFIPAQIKVIEHVRPKYACRECEQTGTENHIKQAKMPVMPISKGIATSSLLSQIITSKYQYSLPLYRQEALFKQYGIALSRQTMSDWLIKSAKLLEPLVKKLKATLLEQSVIQADETTVKVLNENKATCYMWLYCTGTDSPTPESPMPNIVLYDYQASRAGSCVVNYLNDYSNYLQVDGYQGYEQTAATLVGCFAHARRKFIEAKSATKSTNKAPKAGKADMVLSLIQKLYAVEQQIRDKTPKEKQQARHEKAKPILDKLKAYLMNNQSKVPPQSLLGKAINYTLKQWTKLTRYLENGLLNIDNNRAERAIKPFVIGRKNWLFSNTAKGAQASSVLYSIIETAKANGLTPFDYLKTCLDELCQSNVDIEKLLPWNVKQS